MARKSLQKENTDGKDGEDYLGLSWISPDYLGLSWIIVDYLGLSWISADYLRL